MSAALTAYRAATGLLEPFAERVLRGRARDGKEDLARLNERLGRPVAPRPEAPLVWLHGASVGEGVSLLPLVERLRRERPDSTVLVTSGTVTSAKVLLQRLPPGAIHQYIPVDAPGAAKRFLKHWRPSLGVFVESELWPNLLGAAHRRGVKLALLSARIGEASAEGWGRSRGAARKLFSWFDLVMPQDDVQAARLKALGARDDGRLNLKFLGEPLPADAAALDAAKAALGDRPLLLAASTHPGEDELVLDAFARVVDEPSKPLLMIVPRHPVRGPDVARLARAHSYDVGLRSKGEAPGWSQVYVADTLGELGLWFRLARTSLIGGSLVAGVGGHNPLEAARLGCPVASGPHVVSWKQVYEPLVAAGDVTVTSTADELAAFFTAALKGKDTSSAEATMKLIAERSDLEPAFARLKALMS
jgi:3-deoxy-D-manno-octulosonic-acid transferase